MFSYIPAMIAILIASVVGSVLLILSVFFGPKSMNPTKAKPFECGSEQISSPQGRYNVRFYLVAALFLVFDVEIAFLYPWATFFRELGTFGSVEMLVFLFFLSLGLAWAWGQGALEWR